LVQPGHAIEMSEALVRMLDARTDRQLYGKQAQERVLAEFTPQRELAAYWEVYQECLILFQERGDMLKQKERKQAKQERAIRIKQTQAIEDKASAAAFIELVSKYPSLIRDVIMQEHCRNKIEQHITSK